jgi:formate dehydrogenase subunit gamma
MVAPPDAATAAVEETAAREDYFTYVEGVGHLPRDIYKHVKSDPTGDLPRYSPHILIQHILVFSTFIVLAATGLSLLFADAFWAPYVTKLFGGADSARYVHRVAAAIMIFAAVYHILTIVAGTIQKVLKKEFDYRRTQIPRLKDLYDLIHDIKYFLGLEPYRPKMEKFCYKQKLHYLAIIWGTTVLVIAGLALLYPGAMSKTIPEAIFKISPKAATGGGFPSFLQDLARLMHADEAVMALVVIALWHLANVHIVPGRFPFQWTFLTGKITREHQIEEHFLEYIRNLHEIAEEKEYMRNLLIEKGFEVSKTTAGCPPEQSLEQGSTEESTPDKEEN